MKGLPFQNSGAGGGTRTPDPRITKTAGQDVGRENTGLSSPQNSLEPPKTAPFEGVRGQKRDQHQYVTARRAAQLLGIPEDVIVEDVRRGLDGKPPWALAGRIFADYTLIHAYEFDPPRLDMHRARLADWAGVTVISEG